MRFTQFSHRNGKELCSLLHPSLHSEITDILPMTPPYSHGQKKGSTVKQHMLDAFCSRGWQAEHSVHLSGGKKDFPDLFKDQVAIETECKKGFR